MFWSHTTNSIDTIDIPDLPGKLGLVACPGIRVGEQTSLRQRAKNLRHDLKEIIKWQATGVVTLMEENELQRLGLEKLPHLIEKAGLWWRYLPIQDMYIPDDRFEMQWESQGKKLRERLANSERIIIHCRAGLGRTGMIAARILVEFGMDPAMAIAQVREPNRRRIQTQQQYQFVQAVQPIDQVSSSSMDV